MSSEGFDTWILEVRGTFIYKAKQFKTNELAGLSKSNQTTAGQSQIKDLSLSLSPLPFLEMNEQLVPMMEDIQRQLNLFLDSEWDFDQLVKEDLPLVVDYIKTQCNPRDGKLLSIGHSMGGILLYAVLSLCGFEGRDSDFAAVTTLASTLDYSSSKSSLELLLPLTDPAEALNITSIPMGTIFAALHPLAYRAPFILSWLNSQISAQDMMLPELFDRLVLKNFCTIPAKLLLQLATAFESSGLRDRSGTFLYKDHLHKSNVPILAIAGDRDLICPPEAVYETVKVIPEKLITYKVFGEIGGPHYAHYDLVGGRFLQSSGIRVESLICEEFWTAIFGYAI
uniref:AB hydrolase-1 domain-containing protein n=1 Tax=Chenopodium quinoa TaxID=63459 RepID=A0A803MR91_CHEQI